MSLQLHPLGGVYAAAVTPLKADFSPDLDAIPRLLDFYTRRGCHGALLLGTTGEGPSFSPVEREAIWQAGTKVREEHPKFRLLAGTGTPSLEETISLNKTAFALGFDGVVVLPPFYFRNASEEGLFVWFSEVINASVPKGRLLLGYHFPSVCGVPLPIPLLSRLRDTFPDKFGGLKDSSGDLSNALALVKELDDRLVLVGSDSLMSDSLEAGASGCITALANLASPILRQIWDAHTKGEEAETAQGKIDAARVVIDHYRPFPASVKGLLAMLHDFPHWPVKPPLTPFSEEELEQAANELFGILFDQ